MGDKAYDIVMENRKAIVEKLIEQMEQGYAPTRAAWCQADRDDRIIQYRMLSIKGETGYD